MNVDIIHFAIAPPKIVRQRCCNLQHDAHSKERTSVTSVLVWSSPVCRCK